MSRLQLLKSLILSNFGKSILLGLFLLVSTSSVYASVHKQKFQELDQKVRGLKPYSSISALAKKLNSIAKNDWEKARVIYIWLTDNIAYDTKGFFSGRYADTSPNAVFKNKVSVCQGYSDLFKILGEKMGLEVKVISGYAKGYSFHHSKTITRTNHAWNAVKIDGQWFLMDATWGAGHVSGRRFVKSFTNFWFATMPELFLYNHLPQDPEWQLISSPITKHQYIRMKYIPSYRFQAVYSLGFSFHQIKDTLKKYGHCVESYHFNTHRIKIISAPLSPVLLENKKYEFVIWAPDLKKIAIVNNRSWSYLKKKGDRFYGSINPKPNSISVNVHLKYKGRLSYWRMLKYKVR